MRPPSVAELTAVVVLLPSGCAAAAQDAVPTRPAFQAIRYEEDWSALRDPRLRTGLLDRIKYLPIGASGQHWLSLGGETRIRYEQFRNPLFGADPPDAGGYLLHRYLLHADVHLGSRVRGFVQIQAALESERTGGPRAFDENALDLHQAFAEIVLDRGRALGVRLGRQELDFGSSRLVSAREMVNVRQTFDGARILFRSGGSRASVWVVRPVLIDRGVFDDSADSARALWGASWTRPGALLPGSTATAYYIGLAREGARFDQGTADELRHTLGVRVSGRSGRWDYNIEANGQVGRFGSARIRAWDLASDNGFAFPSLPLRPRLGIRTDVTSGDADPHDPELGTFNPLFPNTAYAGLSGLVGPANSIDVQPSARMFLSPRLSVVGGITFFWRTSTRDGLYGIAVNPQRPGSPSRAGSVGRQLALEIDWAPTPNVTCQATLTHFMAGRYLRESPPGANVRYALTWVSYRF